MDYHHHARLTVHGREQLCRSVLEGRLGLCEAAADYKLSRQTASKWVGRYREQSVAGLQDRSSRPHRSPRQTGEALQQRVIEQRLSRWRDLHPPAPIVRYEHPHPGDLLHLDINGMTRFGEVKVRGDGRLRGGRKHPGFSALHAAVDDHSRLAFTRVLADQKAETTIGFLREAVAFFAQRNVQLRALLSDNGSCYRSAKFRDACQQMQMKHRRTRLYTPRTNGKAERFIQTALKEWAYAKHRLNSDQRDAQLQQWTDFYNHQRPHASLNQRPPSSRLLMSTTS
jgi:transposase InsO family protein